ncbi:cytochrome oxidase assembly protein ShyY1 [Nocardia pseudobrasiliensis]|uniref:SURF1-like protein n=1 Tax=Nocardia pseudobrasiliensis TaxID=45979 RepID=A0A370I356_9NOCA|nr:SURF1 family cytochrome oxidase biogenesis protein [Nocardia pseudobrasiliensis]RDI65169.1 cytochrome oxidase assembly protein ShyY1 [Nocardia pseudobrasiliensis]
MNLVRRLTFLLRPSWVILAAVVVAFAYLCFTVLAPWQLGKNNTTSHRNKLIAASVDATPVDVTTLLNDPAAKDTEWRRVIATGTYVPGSTVVERLQRLNDNPAFGILSTFRLDDGRTLLVDRGLLAAADGIRLPPIPEPPAGSQRIEARVRKSEGVTPGKDPMTQDGYRQVYSIDTGQLASVLNEPLTTIPTGGPGGYLELTDHQPGAFTPTPLPQLDAGPYLSYGLQWIAFGIMAPLGLGYFVYAEIRERRRERGVTATAPATESASPATPSTPTREPTNAERLADRYGNAR